MIPRCLHVEKHNVRTKALQAHEQVLLPQSRCKEKHTRTRTAVTTAPKSYPRARLIALSLTNPCMFHQCILRHFYSLFNFKTSDADRLFPIHLTMTSKYRQLQIKDATNGFDHRRERRLCVISFLHTFLNSNSRHLKMTYDYS